jgi:aspartate 1-decarboxylase
MLREMLQGKLHRGVVTECRLDYPGSLTVDIALIERAGMLNYQKIHLLNLTNGNRLETYLIAGERGKAEIVVNGAAARLAYKGDRVIIAAFAIYDEAELKTYKPKVVVLDGKNQVVEVL